MPQTWLQCCTTSTFVPLRPAAPVSARRAVDRRLNSSSRISRQSVQVQAWTQVIDQASGKPYYWNTDTNETAWEMPSEAAATTATVAATVTAAVDSPTPSSSSSGTEAQQPDTMSNDALFDVLAAAYGSDGSGMEFWEVARAHRKYGVFEPPYFDYLDQRQKAAANEAERELAFKMMCRLSNPLLRQPAPFE